MIAATTGAAIVRSVTPYREPHHTVADLVGISHGCGRAEAPAPPSGCGCLHGVCGPIENAPHKQQLLTQKDIAQFLARDANANLHARP
jgi:hypothetical protein